jgi:hypothetical protein
MKSSKPFETAEIYSEGKLVDGAQGEVKSKSLRCLLKFKTHADEVILVKTGISGVSTERALPAFHIVEILDASIRSLTADHIFRGEKSLNVSLRNEALE